jgi:predicted MFS family arabinose efflux permease
MTRIVARLVVSIVAILAAPVLYFIVLIVIYEAARPGRWDAAFWWTELICLPVAAGLWIAVWKSAVKWTASRVALTTGAFVACIACGAVIGGVFGAITNEDEVGHIVASMTWALLWYGSTPLIWCERKAEHAARLGTMGIDMACPNCGYNLTGLREARCPECGSQFTLDELFARVTEDKRQLEA